MQRNVGEYWENLKVKTEKAETEKTDKYFGKKAGGEDIGNGRAEFTETGGSEE